MKMICFGDSNTYGYDACSAFGGRLPKEERWVDILAEMSGWDLANEGLNGREIPRQWFLERLDQILEADSPADLLFLMLGTNDILNGGYVDVPGVGKRMEMLLAHLLSQPYFRADQIVLASPPRLVMAHMGIAEASMETAIAKLRLEYQKLAEKYGVHFIDVGGWQIPLTPDGVHFTAGGHVMFAGKLWEKLKLWESQEKQF